MGFCSSFSSSSSRRLLLVRVGSGSLVPVLHDLLDAVLALRVGPLGAVFELVLLLGDLLLGGHVRGVLTDLGVHALVEVLHAVGVNVGVDELGEVGLVLLVILLLEALHVLRDVAAVDVLGERLGVEGLLVLVVAREALAVVGLVLLV